MLALDPRAAFAVLAILLAALIGLALRCARAGQPFRYTAVVFAAGVVTALETAVAAQVMA